MWAAFTRWRKIIIALLLAGTVGLVGYQLWRQHELRLAQENERQVDALIGKFLSAPSDQTAQALADCLDQEKATPKQGEYILKLLFTPRHVDRGEQYRAGEMGGYTVEQLYTVRFTSAGLFGYDEPRFTSEMIPALPQFHSGGLRSKRVVIVEAGKVMLVEPICRSVCKTVTHLTWDPRIRLMPDKLDLLETRYSTRIALPIEVLAITPDPDKVNVRTSPLLDKNMRESIKLMDADVELTKDSMIRVSFVQPPENFVYRPYFRDQAGKEIDLAGQAHKIEVYTGDTIELPKAELEKMSPGPHRGKLILRASPADCQKGQTTWGGSVEFDFRFTVPPKAATTTGAATGS